MFLSHCHLDYGKNTEHRFNVAMTRNAIKMSMKIGAPYLVIISLVDTMGIYNLCSGFQN